MLRTRLVRIHGLVLGGSLFSWYTAATVASRVPTHPFALDCRAGPLPLLGLPFLLLRQISAHQMPLSSVRALRGRIHVHVEKRRVYGFRACISFRIWIHCVYNENDESTGDPMAETYTIPCGRRNTIVHLQPSRERQEFCA